MSTYLASALWNNSIHHFSSSGYGFTPRRNRHQAVLLLRIQRWRIHQLKKNSICAFYDESNAFPSTSWKALTNATVLDAQTEDTNLLVRRFTHMLSMVSDNNDDFLMFRPGCGDRQGGPPAAQRYILAQDTIIERWSQQSSSSK